MYRKLTERGAWGGEDGGGRIDTREAGDGYVTGREGEWGGGLPGERRRGGGG